MKLIRQGQAVSRIFKAGEWIAPQPKRSDIALFTDCAKKEPKKEPTT